MQPGQCRKLNYLSRFYIPSLIKYFFTNFLCSICVGNELGAGHPKVARTLLVIILSTLYTSSTTVIEAVISLTPLLAFSIFLNGIQPILSGTEGEHIAQKPPSFCSSNITYHETVLKIMQELPLGVDGKQ
jgi:hypothetical protein